MLKSAVQLGQHAEPPHPREHRRRHAEGDHVGERVQLLAELAGGVGEACDQPIHEVEYHGDADGFGGIIEMVRMVHAPQDRLRQRVISQRDVTAGEQ
jgi:hypothetical protein